MPERSRPVGTICQHAHRHAEETQTQQVGFYFRHDEDAQSAHNALAQRGSPLHRWGWKLAMRKHRNLAVAVVARKLAVSIWHLLMGHYSDMEEAPQHLATLLGKQALKQAGFERRDAFVRHLLQSINTSHNITLST